MLVNVKKINEQSQNLDVFEKSKQKQDKKFSCQNKKIKGTKQSFETARNEIRMDMEYDHSGT